LNAPKEGIAMETLEMGRVLTEATIENLKDLWDAERGMIPNDKVRRLHVTDALVDTGATGLALPKRYIQQLGLAKKGEKRSTSAQGVFMVSIYESVRLTILGRDMPLDVLEVPDEIPVLIGQIPLEMFDLVVDPQGRCLIGNPAHGGEQTLELYSLGVREASRER
jgi:predicted aspartyl protease